MPDHVVNAERSVLLLISDNLKQEADVDSNYIEMMIQSLEKKKKILEQIVELDKVQKILLQDPNLDVDDFEQNMKRKGALIDEIGLLDDGFEQLYARVRDTLNDNKERYADQIHSMQDLIRDLSALSVSIQAQEARNKVLVEQKFASVRTQVKSVRNSQKVVQQYYNNMVKANAATSKYLDDKK